MRRVTGTCSPPAVSRKIVSRNAEIINNTMAVILRGMRVCVRIYMAVCPYVRPLEYRAVELEGMSRRGDKAEPGLGLTVNWNEKKRKSKKKKK